MRLILLCLVALLLLIQFPLWLGKGGWLRVWDLDRQVAAAKKKNTDQKARNNKLGSEVQDLKEGTGAVEERARYELGMIKQDEVFVQVLAPKSAATTGSVAPVETAPARGTGQQKKRP
jgi:cell division protein FtsB